MCFHTIEQSQRKLITVIRYSYIISSCHHCVPAEVCIYPINKIYKFLTYISVVKEPIPLFKTLERSCCMSDLHVELVHVFKCTKRFSYRAENGHVLQDWHDFKHTRKALYRLRTLHARTGFYKLSFPQGLLEIRVSSLLFFILCWRWCGFTKLVWSRD